MVGLKRGLMPAALLAALLPCAAGAQQLSYTVPGSYRLTGDVTADAAYAIEIEVDGVVLDLGGHTVRCAPLEPPEGPTVGIYLPERSNVVIRNGRITGCGIGVHAPYGSRHRIVSVDFSGNLGVGLNLSEGRNHVVRGNTFADIAGDRSSPYTIGINGVGSGSLIEGNTFRDFDREPGVEGAGEGVAVLVTAGTSDAVVRGNWIENTAGAAEAMAIWIATESTGITVTENAVSGFREPVQGDSGLVTNNRFLLRTPEPGSVAIQLNRGSAGDNLIVGFERPFSDGVTDTGGNLVLP